MTWPPPDEEDRRTYWNERYIASGSVWGVEPNQFVAQHLAGLPVGDALDLGSGQGRNAIWLASLGHRVTAVDLSDVATAHGMELAATAGVEVDFVAADLGAWEPAREAWDLVLLSYLQLAEDLRRFVHRKAVAALRPGGRLMLIAHHLDNLEHGIGGPQSAAVLATEADLADDFAELEIDRLEQAKRVVEKDDVSGTAIDVLVLAHKSA